MVYFKLNSLIIDLVRVTEMNLPQIACSRFCTRQVISYQSMGNIIKQLVYLREETAKQIAELKDPSLVASKKRGQMQIECLIKKDAAKSLGDDAATKEKKEKETKKKIAKLQNKMLKLDKFKDIKGILDLQDKLEPIYMTKHVCNRAREEDIKILEAALEEEKKEKASQNEKKNKVDEAKKDKDLEIEKDDNKKEEGKSKEDQDESESEEDEEKVLEEQKREEDILLRMDIIKAHDACLADNLKKVNEMYKETDAEKE